MPTPTKGPRLGGSAAHQKAILANLATSLFEHGKIVTTEAKAKRLRPMAEKLITKAKNGSLASRREVMKTIRDKDIVHILFTDIASLYTKRAGGYIRITKTLPRKGDNAPMAIIELIQDKQVSEEAAKIAKAATNSSSKASADKADTAKSKATESTDTEKKATTASEAPVKEKKAAAPKKASASKPATGQKKAATTKTADKKVTAAKTTAEQKKATTPKKSSSTSASKTTEKDSKK